MVNRNLMSAVLTWALAQSPGSFYKAQGKPKQQTFTAKRKQAEYQRLRKKKGR